MYYLNPSTLHDVGTIMISPAYSKFLFPYGINLREYPPLPD